MNHIINKFLSAGDKFMLEMHLEQPEFTQSACGSVTKTKKQHKNLKKQEFKIYLAKPTRQRVISALYGLW